MTEPWAPPWRPELDELTDLLDQRKVLAKQMTRWAALSITAMLVMFVNLIWWDLWPLTVALLIVQGYAWWQQTQVSKEIKPLRERSDFLFRLIDRKVDQAMRGLLEMVESDNEMLREQLESE